MKFNTLDLEIMLGNLFTGCETEKQAEWVKEQIEGALETVYDDWCIDHNVESDLED